MTIREAQQILEEIKYKNFKFNISMMLNTHLIIIKATAPVIDACSGDEYSNSRIIPITTSQTIDHVHFDKMDREHFIYTIYNTCKRLEMHELDEHFKINGECFRNPHPESIKKPA
jgi:hypothetical protein